jgi:hypothetical protein
MGSFSSLLTSCLEFPRQSDIFLHRRGRIGFRRRGHLGPGLGRRRRVRRRRRQDRHAEGRRIEPVNAARLNRWSAIALAGGVITTGGGGHQSDARHQNEQPTHWVSLPVRAGGPPGASVRRPPVPDDDPACVRGRAYCPIPSSRCRRYLHQFPQIRDLGIDCVRHRHGLAGREDKLRENALKLEDLPSRERLSSTRMSMAVLRQQR